MSPEAVLILKLIPIILAFITAARVCSWLDKIEVKRKKKFNPYLAAPFAFGCAVCVFSACDQIFRYKGFY